MSIKEIEAAIAELPTQEIEELMTWLEEYHAQMWDKQIEEDLESGRLDKLLGQVDEEYEAGLSEAVVALDPAAVLAALPAGLRSRPVDGSRVSPQMASLEDRPETDELEDMLLAALVDVPAEMVQADWDRIRERVAHALP